MAQANDEFGTVLGADAKFKGELSFESSAKLLGQIEGSVTSKGKLLIAAGAQCKANLTAKEIAVEGDIHGNINASDRIELKPSGRITGDIVASKMSMEDGASIEGNVRIGINGKSAPSRPSVTPAPIAGEPAGKGK